MANFNSQKRKNSMRKVSPSEETVGRVRLPREKDLEKLAVVTKLVGSDQVRALCDDGEERQFRIPGKLRKRVWLRENDVIIVKLWDFQPSKGDVVWRYLGNQVGWLKKKGYLDKFPI